MDKRATKIVVCCFACTMIIVLLSFIAYQFAKSMSCELIHVEPQNLRNSQLNAFEKDKPTRSSDKTLLMKFSAYFEYNIAKGASSDDDEDDNNNENKNNKDDKKSIVGSGHQSGSPVVVHDWPSFNTPNNNNNNTVQTTQQQVNTLYQNNSMQARLTPIPSNHLGLWNKSTSLMDSRQQLEKKRFLPLDLESIEKRHLIDSPYKDEYILTFNCTKLNIILVRQQDRIFVESMSMDLKKKNKGKSDCDVQLPPGGIFTVVNQPNLHTTLNNPLGTNTVASATASIPNNMNLTSNGDQTITGNDSNSGKKEANNKSKPELVHYYCAKPMRLNCYHTPSSLLLAELHINAIEFETFFGTNIHQFSSKNFKVKVKRECDGTIM